MNTKSALRTVPSEADWTLGTKLGELLTPACVQFMSNQCHTPSYVAKCRCKSSQKGQIR